MPHYIEIFTGGWGICKEVVDIVTLGKCKDCQMVIIPINSRDDKVGSKMKEYQTTAVPTGR